MSLYCWDSKFIRSCNTIIARRWEIQTGQEIRMWQGLFLLLLSVSQMRPSAAVLDGEYSLLLDFTSLSSFNTHHNCEITVKFCKQLYSSDLYRLPKSLGPNDEYSLQRGFFLTRSSLFVVNK